ncbi:MAG: ABC transporter ATP-binding protein [Candidatus Doudnabacteria bacterium]|nr:ABC transporter ATP-binding protein [Candidatus Doudnabacteria bacterium]
MSYVLQANHLTKKFGKFMAVDNISFGLKEGEILGLLGPNGAGKTTTLQMLLGLTTVTGGSISYFGKDFYQHRSEILEEVNFSSAYTKLPWLLTVRQNLTFISYLYNIKDRKARVNQIIKIFHLEKLANQEVRHLSAGETTRLNIAKSLINFPKVLLLDEPTASLDPEVAAYIREFLANERKQFQVSIIITSHNMAEVEELCDRVVFINQGKVIADDTPENLAKSIEISHVRLLLTPDVQTKLIDYCSKYKLLCEQEGRYVIVDIKEKDIPGFLQKISELGISYDEISIERPSLEDYFLQKARTTTR